MNVEPFQLLPDDRVEQLTQPGRRDWPLWVVVIAVLLDGPGFGLVVRSMLGAWIGLGGATAVRSATKASTWP